MKYGPIICDPKSEEAKALLGKKCLFGDIYATMNNSPEKRYKAILGRIEETWTCPFVTTEELYYPFIREVIEEPKKYVPYDLSKPEVRDKLRGRWFKVKSSANEMIVSDLLPPDEDGYSFINGFQTDEFLEKCEWLDGTPCGEEVTE